MASLRFTPDGRRLGLCYARNQTLVNVMRDYGNVDARGLGARDRSPTMRAHNGTTPLVAEEPHRRATLEDWPGWIWMISPSLS